MVIDMTVGSELDDDEMNEEQNARMAPPSKSDDRILTIREALPARTGWKQIFNPLEEKCEVIIAVSKVIC